MLRLRLKGFEPEHALRMMAETRATFTSLVPTHYVMILGLPDGTAPGTMSTA